MEGTVVSYRKRILKVCGVFCSVAYGTFCFRKNYEYIIPFSEQDPQLFFINCILDQFFIGYFLLLSERTNCYFPSDVMEFSTVNEFLFCISC